MLFHDLTAVSIPYLALNKQSYCTYTEYYVEFSVLMLVHLFAFAQSGIEWQKAKKTRKNTRTRA